ncbi:MAG: alpha/beta hydrolase [Bacillota bacterium]|nr:alpha/beta hydrolase [Bacillota bacterium]
MEVLEFGCTSRKKIVLIHGFQIPVAIWDEYIRHYRDDFHILVPVMPEHNPDHPEDFVSFSRTAEEFESYYLSRYGREVYTICAMSMGGVLAATIWQNERLEIQKLILDASPLVPVGPFASKTDAVFLPARNA